MKVKKEVRKHEFKLRKIAKKIQKRVDSIIASRPEHERGYTVYDDEAEKELDKFYEEKKKYREKTGVNDVRSIIDVLPKRKK